MGIFQKAAVAAFVSVVVLIFVGAIVRVTGSGLGCPDWPFCYGCWVPPTKAEDVDFAKLDLEKFRKKAARHGIDPATITEEKLRAEFDPVSTWIEFLNRLTSLPVGLTTLVVCLMGLVHRRQLGWCVALGGMASLALVLINAWMGMKVVATELKPGVITTHMALAILLLMVLVWVGWRGTQRPWCLVWSGSDGAEKKGRALRVGAVILLFLILVEGVMGSQVREMTDELARRHAGENRSEWVAELETTWVYVVHRSFSWIIFALAVWFALQTQRLIAGGRKWLENSVLGLVLAQMMLGLVLSQFGILKIAQVLHIGLSSLLVSGLFLWLLGAWPWVDGEPQRVK